MNATIPKGTMGYNQYTVPDTVAEFEALKLIHGHKAVLNEVTDHMIRARKLLTEACYHTLK